MQSHPGIRSSLATRASFALAGLTILGHPASARGPDRRLWGRAASRR
jgi:hypothetical protein